MMDGILAVITMDANKIAGGAPIFIVGGKEELNRIAFRLEKIMDAMAHELKEDTMIIVKH